MENCIFCFNKYMNTNMPHGTQIYITHFSSQKN
jgi:hypothetical protein